MSSVEESTVGEPPRPSGPGQANGYTEADDARSSARFALVFSLGGLAILTLGLIAVVGLALALDDGEPSGQNVAAAAGTSAAAAQGATSLDISLQEFSITGDLTAAAGDITVNAMNNGVAAHNLAVRELGVTTADLTAGQAEELALDGLAAGTYELVCTISGHEAAGMVANLTVTDSGGGEQAAGAEADSPDDAAGHGGDGVDYAAMDIAMTESILAFPAETEGRGNPVLEPTEVTADGTKVFDLTASIVDWEVEPGKMVEAWTYNEVVPAPQILLDRGDKVRVRLVNDLPMGTDIHWHGVRTPNDQDGVAPITQDLVEPNGGTFTYEFVAEENAIGMYHAHNHAQVQVINGMFGVIRIGENPVPRGSTISGVTIPEDVELAVDMPMVLNDAGTIGFSLNGKSFPATDPVVLEQGQWASISYYNEGLEIHPMHLHQFPQLVYAKDGIPLDEPYWVDTLNVAPGERYTVMFRGDDVGTWVWHCHILTHVERAEGMFGMVTAIVVTETPGFDPNISPVTPTNWIKPATES